MNLQKLSFLILTISALAFTSCAHKCKQECNKCKTSEAPQTPTEKSGCTDCKG